MTDEFAYVPDVERGAWLADRLDAAEGAGLSASVPSGFDALVRVLHPFSRDRPVTGSWSAWAALQEADPAIAVPETIDDPEVSWWETAQVHGTPCVPESRSHELLGLGYGEHRDLESADGWRYRSPEEGSLIAPVLGRVADVLASHTETPERGVAAVWDGWSGLVSAQGVGFFVFAPLRPGVPALLQRPVLAVARARAAFGERRARFGTAAALRALVAPGWRQPAGSGLLSRAAARGPRLALPDRDYICFEAGIADFAAGAGRDWTVRAPWIDRAQSWWVQSPNLIWPDGEEWMLLSEIDFDSTLIACSRACADALLGAPGIESVEITRDAELWSS